MRYEIRVPLRIDFGGTPTDAPEYLAQDTGVVLTAAITRYVRGRINRPDPQGRFRSLRSDRSYVTYSYDVPARSGLGAMAAQTVLWATLLRAADANDLDRVQIASASLMIAESLGILDGKSDAYACALGGVTLFTLNDAVLHERVHLDSRTAEALQERLLLVNVGGHSVSPTRHEGMWSRFGSGDSGVRSGLAKLKRLAVEMKGALVIGDLDGFCDCVGESGSIQRTIDPAVRAPGIEDLISIGMAAGAIGSRVCNPPEEGSVLFLTRAGEARMLRRALARRRLSPIEVGFDQYGVYLTKTDASGRFHARTGE